MGAVLEFNLEDEITKTTQLILELTQAMESLTQRQHILEEERSRLYNEINESKHRMLTDFITHLTSEIHRLEAFPSIPYRKPTIRRIPPFPTAKELGEPVQINKVQFQHNNKNLATERKMARELREHERERQEQLQIKANFALREVNLQERSSKIKSASRYHRPKPLPKKSLKSLIVMWAEKIEYASSQVLRDSKNVAPTRKTNEHLQDLRETSKQFYSRSSIDQEKFAKHWNLMRETRNSFAQIKFDLMKESRRHAEGYAETQRLGEKVSDLNTRLWNMYAELSKICREKSAASKYLVKLQRKQNEVASPLP